MKNNIYFKRTSIKVPAKTLYQWHTKNSALLRLTPPWAPLKLVYRSGQGVKKGVKVIFKISLFKIPLTWEAEHMEHEENYFFKDRQLKGPFSKWEHTHTFIPDGDNNSIMEDKIEFKLPFGFLSSPFNGFARKEFERMFSYRHRILKYDLEHHVPSMKKKRKNCSISKIWMRG